MAKYNADGLLLWATQAGGDSVDQGFAIAVDASGHSYITGLFEGSATFGAGEGNETTLTSTGSRDIFLAKYSADGQLVWATQAGGRNSNGHAEGIVVDASRNIYLTGFFNDSTTFGGGEINETILRSTQTCAEQLLYASHYLAQTGYSARAFLPTQKAVDL